MLYEVKSCPMCGGYSKLEARSKTIIKGELRYTTYCRCCDCGLRGPRVLLSRDNEHNAQEARRTAVERWNRRVYED